MKCIKTMGWNTFKQGLGFFDGMGALLFEGVFLEGRILIFLLLFRHRRVCLVLELVPRWWFSRETKGTTRTFCGVVSLKDEHLSQRTMFLDAKLKPKAREPRGGVLVFETHPDVFLWKEKTLQRLICIWVG